MSITNLLSHLINRFKKTLFSCLATQMLVAGSCFFPVIATMADTHNRLQKTPCDIRLEFGSDERGMPSIGYKLSLQISNRTARYIAGVAQQFVV